MKAILVAVALAVTPLTVAAQKGPQPMKDPPKLTVAVTMKEAASKRDPKVTLRTLRGTGEAAYPDGAALQFGIRMKDDQNFIIRTQGFVSAGKWDIELPVLGDDIYKGMYVCQVDFDPDHQGPGVLPKIAADKRGLNSAAAEQKIGTDEEIAKETAVVHGYYKLKLGELRGLIEAVLVEFRAQLTLEDAVKWKEVTSKSSDAFFKIDQEISEFRKRRRNVMSIHVCDGLAGLILKTRDYAFEDFSDAITERWDLKDPGKTSKLSGAESQEKNIRTLLEKLDAALANAVAAPLPEKK